MRTQTLNPKKGTITTTTKLCSRPHTDCFLTQALRRYPAQALLSLQVAHSSHYLGALQRQNIVLSIEDRQQLIWEAVEATAGLVGAHLPQAAAQELLEEVTNLVEAPTVVLGDFDPAFLSLPK